MLSAVINLIGGFSLRWGIVHGGHQAADDPHLSRIATGTPDRQQLMRQPRGEPGQQFQHVT